MTFSACDILRSDLAAYKTSHTVWPWALYYALTIPGFRCVTLFRLSSFLAGKGRLWRIPALFLRQLNMFCHGCDFSPDARIGKGLFLPHPTGIVLGRGARVGEQATLYHNVTIGMRHSRHAPVADDYPTVGSHVVVGCGAVIIGAVKVGDHVCVGANAVVTKDVPDHATAVGIPARIILDERT